MTARTSACIILVVAFLILLCGDRSPLSAQEPASAEYAAALQQARDYSQKGRHKAALKAYTAANKLAGGESARCLLAMAVLYNVTKDYKNAAASAQRVLGLTEESRALRRAHLELGLALVLGARKHGEIPKNKLTLERLKDAEQAFRQALDLDPGDGEIHYLLANVLADRMVTWEQWSLHEEIKSFASKYLELQPDGTASGWAREASCQVYQTSPSVQRTHTEKPRLFPPATQTAESPDQEIVGPVKISSPGPQYTEWARQARIQGTVIVQAIIDSEGNVSNAKVLMGLPLCLSEMAVATIMKWKFKPALFEGVPTAVCYNLTVNFGLE